MKLSIIIPTIGRDTLEVVLKALLLNNNFDQIKPEIMVVFDGKKTDGEWLLIKGLEKVKVLETGTKVYAAGARNLGIKNATGDVLAFIGDDTIPAPDWLEQLYNWHENNPEPEKSLLGKVDWIDELAGDRFHVWLAQKALFDYAQLDKGMNPNWRHFYTSNISVKKELLQNKLFSTEFTGWGFEDSELGYRLEKQGMELSYDPKLVVKHDDPQTLVGLIKRTSEARTNAQVFETLHPELKILPTGLKRLFLKAVVMLSAPLQFVPQIKWWRVWKKAWLQR